MYAIGSSIIFVPDPSGSPPANARRSLWVIDTNLRSRITGRNFVRSKGFPLAWYVDFKRNLKQ